LLPELLTAAAMRITIQNAHKTVRPIANPLAQRTREFAVVYV